jgi:hypothetical protein
MPADQPARAAIWPGVVALVWIGLLIGVSLLATPVKFRAPSLDLPVALDVGRHTFAAFNLVEIFALVLLALAVILGNRTRLLLAALAGIAAVSCFKASGCCPPSMRGLRFTCPAPCRQPARSTPSMSWAKASSC